ncbi:MAG: beta-lactamase family protein [Bacilli bacterium]|nr:beta-lactamase family protein [Bacilli bacterium]
MEFLNDKINDLVADNVIPGMTYAIIKDETVNIGSSGYKSLLPLPTMVKDDTIYDIASLTKVLVIVPLISQLIDNEIVNFNDKVTKYLPRFKYSDITIYQLLTHTSGLPADLSSKEILSKEEILKQIYSLDKIYEPGSKVVYSDIGYILLGEVIEHIYHQSLDIVVKEELFIPLEMYDTSYNPLDKDRCAPTEVTLDRGIIQGIVHDEKACSMNGIAGNAGVFSTVHDLSNFVSMVLNNGIYKGKRILSEEIIDLWFQPLIYEKERNRYRSLCFIVGNNDLVIEEGNNDVISFNGFTGPSISIDRDNHLGIILMTNRIHPTRDNRKISDERPKITNLIYENLVYSNKRLTQ